MIDPENITDFNRSDSSCQEMLLFAICVAGKNARRQAVFLENFLTSLPEAETVFERLMLAFQKGNVGTLLRATSLGKYTLLEKAFKDLIQVQLNVKTCTVEDLEMIHGVGPKTARFFLLHTRPNQRVSALDTHVLKLLREHGYDAPKVTPVSKSLYRRLEVAFLSLADAAGMTVADFDLMIWNKYSKK